MQGKNKKPPAMLQHHPEAEQKTRNRSSHTIVTNFIPIGEENKVSTAELVRRVGCKTARELQALIESARNQGAVICSTTSGGYFLPATKDELRRHVHTVDARARNSLKSNTSARQLLERLEAEGSEEGGRTIGPDSPRP